MMQRWICCLVVSICVVFLGVNVPAQGPTDAIFEPISEQAPARNAGDVKTLIVQVKQAKLTNNFNPALRDDLLARLQHYDPTSAQDRELLESTRNYLNGQLKERLFVLYVRALPALQGDSFTNSIGMTLKLIPAGSFTMGSNEGENDEKPPHQVTITKAFRMQTTEVTQAQWKEVMGTEPWKRGAYTQVGADYPATLMSWEDAVEFCRKLSQRERKQYRLPTEAEWEHACRAGSSTEYSFGDDASQLGQYAWFGENICGSDEDYAHRVGQKRANSYGLYDMHGNVWEWCSDWYDGDYYATSATSDPQGPNSGSSRVLRGGSWSTDALNARSGYRRNRTPRYQDDTMGFRIVCE